MKNKGVNTDSLFFLGKTNEEELTNDFDGIYDSYRYLAKRKGYKGDIKFVKSLDNIYIYVKIG
jgi:hypothetical protein